MYGHHRYLKSPFLRNKKSQEEVQLLPEIGLARKHSGNSIQDASMVGADCLSIRSINKYNIIIFKKFLK